MVVLEEQVSETWMLVALASEQLEMVASGEQASRTLVELVSEAHMREALALE